MDFYPISIAVFQVGQMVLLHLITKPTGTVAPEAIWVKGDFAFVHYSYTEVEVDMEGKEKLNAGRWTDILMKDGNKWVMVGDSGGETSGND
jgi:ketosteroid isomerase-like protein